jgi:hypothetical protein
MRPSVGETGAGLEVRTLVRPSPSHPAAMVSAVGRAELPGVAPYGPRAAGRAVGLRLDTAPQLSRLLTVGHLLAFPSRYFLSVPFLGLKLPAVVCGKPSVRLTIPIHPRV